MSIFKSFNSDIKKTLKKSDLVFDSDIKKEAIGTGSIVIDTKMDGGISYLGRMTEISSFESGGKTTLALLTVAEALKKYPDKGVIYLDAELALDSVYMKRLGADPDNERLLIYQPKSVEEAEKILFKAFEGKGGKPGSLHGSISLLVIDSVAAMRSESEFNDMIEGSNQHATAWGRISVKLNYWAKNNGMAILLINQMRAKPQISNNDRFSLSNNGIAQGYSNTDTSLTTCVSYDTLVDVMIDGEKRKMTMSELEEQYKQHRPNDIIDLK